MICAIHGIIQLQSLTFVYHQLVTFIKKNILKVVEIQCFEMKSCVSGSLLILCTLLKASDTSLINDVQRKVYIFLQFLNFTIINQSKIGVDMFALKDTKNFIFHTFESIYLWVWIYPKRTPLDPLLLGHHV